jgi:hypothetical protein
VFLKKKRSINKKFVFYTVLAKHQGPFESRVGWVEGKPFQRVSKNRKKKLTLEGGLEPPTLWLTATRSGQLSYSSSLCFFKDYLDVIVWCLMSAQFPTLKETTTSAREGNSELASGEGREKQR